MFEAHAISILEGQERREFHDWCTSRLINPTRLAQGDEEEIDAARHICQGYPLQTFRRERQMMQDEAFAASRAAYGRAMGRCIPKPDWFDQAVKHSENETRRRRAAQ